MPRVVHFEIPAEKPERSIAFYEKVFGWKFQKWNGPIEYWLITTGGDAEPGINGGIMRRNDPNQPVTYTIQVSSVDDACAEITAAGGEVVVPRMPIPGVGYLAYFKDLDGNITGVTHSDPNAG